jgi:hypothetical protein
MAETLTKAAKAAWQTLEAVAAAHPKIFRHRFLAVTADPA